MKINTSIKPVKTFLDTNSPVILTGLGLIGLGATVYLTAKGSQQSTLVIKEEVDRRNNTALDPSPITNQEKFLLTYKFYAPAAIATVGTGACMIMATKIGLNRTAALGAALVVAERGNEQYRDKVKEILGENKHTKVVDAVAGDQVAGMQSSRFAPVQEGDQTYIDAWTGRDISSSREKMEKAVNEFNKEMLIGLYSSLNDFYTKVGLGDIQMGDEIGWNVGGSNDSLLELTYTTVLKDDRAVVVFTFNTKPMPGFRAGDV